MSFMQFIKQQLLNMKAKFTPKIKEQIANRDYNKCILCYDPPHSVHHVYY